MAEIIRMPKMSDTMEEGVIAEWLKKVGDEVIIHCNRDDGDDEECNGGEPMYSKSQRIWGYETNDGSFAQCTTVQSRQLLRKHCHLSW